MGAPTGRMNERVALITGSTRGIGNAIARRLASEGARVIVHGRDEGAVAKAVSGIKGALGVAGDISDPEAVRTICERLRDRVGRVDVVVNNAGTSSRNLFLDATDQEWDRLLAVNLMGPRNVLREFVPDMQRQGWGRILNVISEAGVRGTPGFSAYAASKGALLAVSLTLAQELLPFGVHVNALAPLAFTDLVRTQLSPKTLRSSETRGFPTLDDCAAAALPLLTEDAPTGQVVIMHFGDQPTEVVADAVASRPWVLDRSAMQSSTRPGRQHDT
jgi:NAD(P)-dependent dehydrogenase (short-subunit alcohol dehydrogenase family)